MNVFTSMMYFRYSPSNKKLQSNIDLTNYTGQYSNIGTRDMQ